MNDIVYREVSQPARLKASELEGAEYAWLGRNPRAVIGTDLDQNAWPSQLDIHYDSENDITIVAPKGQHNNLGPWKLTGMISPGDVKRQFITNVVEPVIEEVNADVTRPEMPIADEVSEVRD